MYPTHPLSRGFPEAPFIIHSLHLVWNRQIYLATTHELRPDTTHACTPHIHLRTAHPLWRDGADLLEILERPDEAVQYSTV